MQNAMPFRWIEEAEARAVLAAALCERPLAPSRGRPGQRLGLRLQRLRQQLAEYLSGSPALRTRPALVHQRAARRSGDNPRSW